MEAIALASVVVLLGLGEQTPGFHREAPRPGCHVAGLDDDHFVIPGRLHGRGLGIVEAVRVVLVDRHRDPGLVGCWAALQGPLLDNPSNGRVVSSSSSIGDQGRLQSGLDMSMMASWMALMSGTA